MAVFRFTEGQITEVNAGYTPISRYTPNRVIATNENGYAFSTDVSTLDLENFEEIVDSAQGIFLLDSLTEL